jgi:hypothetical protein
MTSHSILLPTLLLGSLAACDSQVDGDHNGTALAEIHGQVESMRTGPVDDAQVAIVWQNSSGSPDLVGVDTVDVTGSFPAQFHLAIYTPPEDTLINNFGDSRMGVAYIFAAKAGTDFSSDQSAEAGVLGLDPDHLLIYLPENLAAGTLASTLLRGTPSAGFHLYNVGHLTDAEKDQRRACAEGLGESTPVQVIYDTCGGSDVFDDFLPAADDLDAVLKVDLVDDLDQLDVPNWT